MALDKPTHMMTPSERIVVSNNLSKAEEYGRPRRVWVEDGHVFVEGHDGRVISMVPELAIAMGRLLSDAGADSLINRVIDDNQST